MRRENFFWGILLILLGGLFLLHANGVITDVLGWFWPLALILLGAWVLVARYLPRCGSGDESFSINLQGANRLDLDIDHGGGSVSISAGAPEGVAICGSQAFGLEIKSQREGESLGVDLDAGPTFLPFIGPQGGEWRFNLTQEVPVAIKLDAGATSLDLDMTDIKLTFLGVDAGASGIKVKLPANAGQTLVDITAGAASIDLSIPQGVGARIRMEQGVSSINIDESRFQMLTSLKNMYQSSDYDTAANRVEINLECGASTISVR
jgi:hypothetical protein